MSVLKKIALLSAILGLFLPISAWAQGASGAEPGPLRITVTDGIDDPHPIALPDFLAADPTAQTFAGQISDVIKNDLESSRLIRVISSTAYISQVNDVNLPPAFADWQAINAIALVAGGVSSTPDGRLLVQFRLWDTFAQREAGEGLQFSAPIADWRRLAHKVADQVYARLTGESPYFDSQIAFIDESGPKNARRKRLAIMDQDGANVEFLTSGNDLVLAPRFSPDGKSILYTSYREGIPRVYLMNLDTKSEQALDNLPGMTFAPRFSPDGKSVIMSLSRAGNTDLYTVDLATRQRRRLTRDPSIETAPSFSPDGRQIVFESDRGGSQQLYVMPAAGGTARRISFGDGRYGTPAWSPRGDQIAFTKIKSGVFHIGVMRVDGTHERLLTTSFLDEGPTWSPNGRVLMFFRETSGPLGAPSIISVDVTGKKPTYIRTPAAASDPTWSPLRGVE